MTHSAGVWIVCLVSSHRFCHLELKGLKITELEEPEVTAIQAGMLATAGMTVSHAVADESPVSEATLWKGLRSTRHNKEGQRFWGGHWHFHPARVCERSKRASAKTASSSSRRGTGARRSARAFNTGDAGCRSRSCTKAGFNF